MKFSMLFVIIFFNWNPTNAKEKTLKENGSIYTIGLEVTHSEKKVN